MAFDSAGSSELYLNSESTPVAAPPQMQTLYMPIDSPPTPAPSPGPPSIMQLIQQPSTPIVSPLTLPQNPLLRKQYLSALLHACTPAELLFISTTIAPLLKRDPFRALPTELALHVLSFVEEPIILVRAGQVSRWWRRLVGDEGLWRRMCTVFGFNDPRTTSFKEHFKYSYTITQNWYHGGHLLRAHRVPSSSTPAQDNASVVTSLALNSEWVVVGLANYRIHVFSAKTGVLARTLVGHELGVWAVCLVGSGGYMGEWEYDMAKKKRKRKRRKEEAAEPRKRPEYRSHHSESDIKDNINGDYDFYDYNNEAFTGAGVDLADSQFVPPSLRVALGLSSDLESESSGADAEGMDWANDEGLDIVINEDAELEDIDMDIGGEGPRASPVGHPGKPSSPTGSSEGWGQPNALVVSGGCDKVVKVWDIRSGYCIYTLPGHTSTIRCIKVLHNRPIAVSGSRDCTVRVWDIQRGRLLRTLSGGAGGHSASVRCLDVCGNRVVSGSYDNTCRLWNVDTGECIHVLRGHLHQIYSVAFDGYRIVSGGLDTTVRVWDAGTGMCLATLQGHTALVCQLQLSRTMLATGGSDGRVIMFSLPPVPAPPFSSSPSSSSPSPWISSSSHRNQREQINYRVLHRLAAHDSSVTSLQFNERFLVTGGNDGRVRLYETRTGKYVRDLFRPGSEGVNEPGADCVWKVGYAGSGLYHGSGANEGYTERNDSGCGYGEGSGTGAEVCAIMCQRQGKTVMEIWSLKPKLERGDTKNGKEEESSLSMVERGRAEERAEADESVFEC